MHQLLQWTGFLMNEAIIKYAVKHVPALVKGL